MLQVVDGHLVRLHLVQPHLVLPNRLLQVIQGVVISLNLDGELLVILLDHAVQFLDLIL